MKRLAIVALVLLAVGATTTQLAQAQSRYGEGFGAIYIVNDVAADPFTTPLASCNDNADPIPPFSSFSWFLVVSIDFADINLGNQNGSNGIQAWEASVSIPDEITVTGKTLKPPTSVNVGNDPAGDPNDSNWIVGTGTLISAASTPYAVVEYTGLLLAAGTNLTMQIGGATPSSFTDVGGPGMVPGWVEWNKTGECPNECLRDFKKWDGCKTWFVINYEDLDHQPPRTCADRCVVATKNTSWGNLKSKF